MFSADSSLGGRLGLTAVVALLASMTLGCEVETGSGVIVSQKRSIAAAQSVKVCCGFEVEFAVGEEPELVVTTDDNLIDDLAIDIDDGVLEIGWGDEFEFYDPSQPVHLELTLPKLVHFEGSGGMRLLAGDLSSEQLTIDLNGGSQAHMAQVWVDRLRVNESGGSRIRFDLISAKETQLESSGGSRFEGLGLSNVVKASISGGGKLLAEDLIADRAQLDLSGGSRVELTVLEQLRGEASGGSQIILHGNPDKDIDLSGGSKLK